MVWAFTLTVIMPLARSALARWAFASAVTAYGKAHFRRANKDLRDKSDETTQSKLACMGPPRLPLPLLQSLRMWQTKPEIAGRTA